MRVRATGWPARRMGAALLVLSTLLAGCLTTREVFIAPPSVAGQQCAAQCGVSRQMCDSYEFGRAQAEYQNCERYADARYRHCLAHARDDKEARRCYRPACWLSPDNWRCDINYRDCFVACGGTIQVIEKE